MKSTAILAMTLAAFTSLSAFANSEQDIVRVRTAMKSKVGISNKTGDVRLNVYKIDSSICGSSGSSIIADFEVKKFEKVMDSKGNIGLKSKWEVVKTYGIPLAAVEQLTDAQLKSEIMDSEACLE
ncbi:MAG: hypothetical protein ACXVLQ_00245 [Bacteriovorax sp.]